jgi:hypothetical protein
LGNDVGRFQICSGHGCNYFILGIPKIPKAAASLPASGLGRRRLLQKLGIRKYSGRV